MFVAASTHEGEEEIVAQAHRELTRGFESLCTIIAPRHPERGTAIAERLKELGLSVTQRSRGALPGPQTDIYIADTIGELGTLYALAPIAFIGGSLVERGGQNPIEAIRHGTAVITGPYWHNFPDAYRALLRHKGVMEDTRCQGPSRRGSPVVAQPGGDSTACAKEQRTRLARSPARSRRRWRRCCFTCPTRDCSVPLEEPGWWYGGAAPHRFVAPLLPALSQCYGWLAQARFKSATPYRSRLPVICVGNFTAGGTGKTPLAIFIANLLKERGENPCFLTRGYGGSEKGPAWVEGRHRAAARFRR